jgi:hypothetical protein
VRWLYISITDVVAPAFIYYYVTMWDDVSVNTHLVVRANSSNVCTVRAEAHSIDKVRVL